MLGMAGLIGQVCALGGWLLVWGISPRKGQWRPRVQEGLLHPPVLLPRLLPAGPHVLRRGTEGNLREPVTA